MAKRNTKIVIYGFSGAGKTTTARLVSRSLGLAFYDTDKLIEKRYKSSISSFIKRYGIERFREVEKKIFKRLLRMKKASVISVGGGVFPCGYKFKKTDIMEIFLDTPYDVISKRFRRISKTRPLIKAMIDHPQNIKKLYLSRCKLYKKAEFKLREKSSIKAAQRIVKIYYENAKSKE